VWDGNAVSKQCGAAVMLKMIVETGAIGQPS
jgi:lysozyme family protein